MKANNLQSYIWSHGKGKVVPIFSRYNILSTVLHVNCKNVIFLQIDKTLLSVKHCNISKYRPKNQFRYYLLLE